MPESGSRPSQSGLVCLVLLALTLLLIQLLVFPALKIAAAEHGLPGTPRSLLNVLLHPPRPDLLAPLVLAGLLLLATEAKSMLEADGSTIVMLSEMEDTRELMLNVAKLLQEFGCGLHTQGLEKDVEKALEDMIMAIQKERKRRDEEEQQGGGQGSGQGQGQQQPLIPLSAELKMLKALQLRINYRTVGLQAARPKMKPHTLHQQAAALAKRQGRVGTLTRELSAKIRADRAARGGGGGF